MDASELQEQARAGLEGTRFADVRWVDETGSTNADLLAAAADGAPDGSVLLAEAQTAGRGRLGRDWSAPAGSSLLCSILLRPSLVPADAHLVSVAVALAARTALDEVAGLRPVLKWPNDLIVERPDGTRKVAGILAESRLAGDHLEAVVVGIGLNVNWPPELPDDLAAIATAANHEVGHEVDRVAVLVALLGHLDGLLDDLDHARGRAEVAERYATACATVGQQVRVGLGGAAPEDELVGRAVAVTPSGHLLVEVTDTHGDRHRREVAVGDVTHVRPAG